ncbi:hypothetical protein BGZ81_001901, partial [Podila clonocystis]
PHHIAKDQGLAKATSVRLSNRLKPEAFGHSGSLRMEAEANTIGRHPAPALNYQDGDEE